MMPQLYDCVDLHFIVFIVNAPTFVYTVYHLLLRLSLLQHSKQDYEVLDDSLRHVAYICIASGKYTH